MIFNKFEEEGLPSIEHFYSKLTGEDISDCDYNHAENVWKKFKCKTMGDYRAFRKLSSIYVFSYFPFGFKGRIWDLIVSVPDHCLSFYFAYQSSCGCAVWWP